MALKFRRCAVCGNIIAVVGEEKGKIICCSREMTEMIPGEFDASPEKHVPVFHTEHNRVFVKVGETPHPTEENHFIDWIAITTNRGNRRNFLKHGEPAQTCFALCDDEKVLAVYAYCSLHGLWKAEAED